MDLKNGKSVYVDQVKMRNDQLFYRLKPGIWVSYNNFKNYDDSAPKLRKGKIQLQKAAMIYTDPSFKKCSGRKLPKNSSWNYFAKKKVYGKTAYNLGGSQWITQ